MKNCVFANNNAAKGGGLQIQVGGTVTNSTFYNNTADTQGGGIFFNISFDDPVTLQNSLFVGNTAADVASGHQVYVANVDSRSRVNIQHNLLAGGAAGIVYEMSGASGITEENTVTESDASVVFASTDADHADYLRLKEFSPAVGAGNNDYLNNGTPTNPDDDITTDAAGNARIQVGTVDLGAYESAFAASTPQVITFTLATVGAVGQSIDLVATTDATGLNVSFAITTEPETGVATLTNNDDGTGTLQLDGAGTVIVTARQDGGSNGEGATYAVATARQTLTVRVPSIRRVTTIGDAGNDGSTWTQAMTLQAALAVATVGDQVWIAQGIYRPGVADDSNPDTDERAATFRIPEGVFVYGGFVGTDLAIDDDGFDPVAGTDGRARGVDGAFTNETILSGDLATDDGTQPAAGATQPVIDAYAATRDDNSHTVVTIAGAGVRLNGLTITAGEGALMWTTLVVSRFLAGLVFMCQLLPRMLCWLTAPSQTTTQPLMAAGLTLGKVPHSQAVLSPTTAPSVMVAGFSSIKPLR